MVPDSTLTSKSQINILPGNNIGVEVSCRDVKIENGDFVVQGWPLCSAGFGGFFMPISMKDRGDERYGR